MWTCFTHFTLKTCVFHLPYSRVCRSQSGYSRRSKDLHSLIGISDSLRSSKYGSSRIPHHSSSRGDSPGRGSAYSSSRTSPSRDYNNPSGSSYRNSGNTLSSLVGLSTFKQHSQFGDSSQVNRSSGSNRYDRSRVSLCRKSMAPTSSSSSLDFSRNSNGGGGPYQHSTGYNNGEDTSPSGRHQSRSHRRSNYVASSRSGSSSLERKDGEKKDRHASRSTDRPKRDSSRRKSSRRTSTDNSHPYPAATSSPRRHLRESTVSTPEPSNAKPTEGPNDSRERCRSVVKHKDSRTKSNLSSHEQQKNTVMSTANDETLSKLQRERMELLMKLSMLQTQSSSQVQAPCQPLQRQCNG